MIIRLPSSLGICSTLPHSSRSVAKRSSRNFSLILENDLAAAEKDISFHLIPVLEEILGMLQLEIVIVVIGIGAETNLFDHNLHSFGFQLLGFFLLLVKELRIVDDPANGGIGLR